MVEPLVRDPWPGSAAVYLEAGLPRAGQRFRNRDLAATYRRLVRDAEASASGRDEQVEAATGSFYSGFVAEAIERHCRAEVMDSSGTAHPGLLTGADMALFDRGLRGPGPGVFPDRTRPNSGPWCPRPRSLHQLHTPEQ